ncbi:extracellular solute-binding protein [Paenibacillus contaminans]|nr:extracellular solute-binding protein [Paenibacillus contaminans]
MSFRQLKTYISAAAIASMALTVAACGKDEGGSGKPSPSAPADTGKPKAEAGPPAKFDPPITVSTVKALSDSMQKGITLQSDVLTNNIWSRGYESELGIKVNYLWTVPSTQMQQKMNMAISSNDLPDIIPVSAQQLKMLVDTGVALDLTELFDKYATPFTKQMWEEDQNIGRSQATVDGKLMALPNIAGSIDGSQMIWIRADWLKKLGLQPPKTMEDVAKIAEAFTKKDPDGNGKDDTYGLGLDKSLNGLNGFFQGYHAYVNGWVKDASGKMVNGTIQPQTKTALSKLAEMYKNGYIDKEFAVKDASKASELVVGGKVGMFFGSHSYPFVNLQDSKNKNPEADWRAYPLASVDDQPAKPLINGSATSFYAVNKKMKNPEAAIMLYNYYYEKDPAISKGFDPKFHGINGEQETKPDQQYIWAALQTFYPKQNMFIHENVKRYIETKDKALLDNYWVKDNAEQIEKYLAGDNKLWSSYAWSGPEDSAISVISYYNKNNLFQVNGYIKGSTDTMAQKGSTLTQIKDETFTKIIMGTAPIDEFDSFADKWKKLGGDEITKEINEMK